MEAEKVRLGRKTQHIKKKNEKQPMHAEQKGQKKKIGVGFKQNDDDDDDDCAGGRRGGCFWSAPPSFGQLCHIITHGLTFLCHKCID